MNSDDEPEDNSALQGSTPIAGVEATSIAQQSAALVVRTAVAPLKNYLDHRDQLRHDFCYACAYCCTTEVEGMAVGFEIDHYDPLRNDEGKRNEYDNLMWSCRFCNRYKSGYYPTPEQQSRGLFVLRPDREDPRPHFDASGLLWKGTTTTGAFNIDRVELNRPELVTIRRLRARLASAQEFIAFGVREILATSLDAVKPAYRTVLENWQSRVSLAQSDAKQSIDEFIRTAVRSPLLDTPVTSTGQRDRLSSIAAIGPNIPTADRRPSRGGSRAPRRRQRKR